MVFARCHFQQGMIGMDSKFEIGDRVRYVGGAYKIGPPLDDCGSIVHLESRLPDEVGVSFDGLIPGGHTCNGKAVAGHGWYCKEDEIELVEPAQKEFTSPLTIHTAPHGGYYVSQGDEVLYAALDTGDLSLFVEEFLDDNQLG